MARSSAPASTLAWAMGRSASGSRASTRGSTSGRAASARYAACWRRARAEMSAAEVAGERSAVSSAASWSARRSSSAGSVGAAATKTVAWGAVWAAEAVTAGADDDEVVGEAAAGLAVAFTGDGDAAVVALPAGADEDGAAAAAVADEGGTGAASLAPAFGPLCPPPQAVPARATARATAAARPPPRFGAENFASPNDPPPALNPVKRHAHAHPGQPPLRRPRRPPIDLRLVGVALRGRLQPLLPRQVRRRLRRPDLHPGPRRPRRVLPGLPRGPPHRGPARPLPPGGRRRRPAELPPPAADARLLGVPHGVDGHRPAQRRLPGPVQPLPAPPPDRRHLE